jgi:hypothetical protein
MPLEKNIFGGRTSGKFLDCPFCGGIDTVRGGTCRRYICSVCGCELKKNGILATLSGYASMPEWMREESYGYMDNGFNIYIRE